MNPSRRTVTLGILASSGLSLTGCAASEPTASTQPSSYATDTEKHLEEIFIWGDSVPGPPPSRVKPDDPYHVAAPSMFVYQAPEPNGAAILLCQGGGYRGVGRSSAVPLYWQAQGYTVFDLRYRLPHAGWAAGPDVTLQDAQRAMRVIRSRADAFGIEPSRTGVMGYSSGGHMATYFGTAYHRDLAPEGSGLTDIDARPAFIAVGCPVVTTSGPFAHQGSVNSMFGKARVQPELDARSPEKLVTKDTPPMFMVHAANDTVVPPENSIMLYRALREHGVSTEMHIFRTGGHSMGAGYNPTSPLAPYPGLMKAFIERQLG